MSYEQISPGSLAMIPSIKTEDGTEIVGFVHSPGCCSCNGQGLHTIYLEQHIKSKVSYH